MKQTSETFQFCGQIASETTPEGIRRQIMGYDEKVMLVRCTFDTGTVATRHSHPHSQLSYVVSGKFEAHIGDDVKIIGPGDGYYVEPDLMHHVVCLEGGVLLDIFSPRRDDFLK